MTGTPVAMAGYPYVLDVVVAPGYETAPALSADRRR